MKDLSESRVLIVDDDRSSVDILVGALQKDYKLSVAVNGPSALWTIQMSPPDLVLLDIVMPGMDGYEVCRQLRSAPATREIPILFLSGLEQVEAKAKGFELGGNDYVTKPFEILEVQARVRSLLKAKAYADAVKEQWAAELRIAHEIQLGLLPANLSAVAQGSGLDIDGILQPARGVGGDFYEVTRTANGQVLFVMGDVSGQGVPAAILMTVILTVIRMMAGQFQQPEVILRWVRDALAVHRTKGMTVTLFCGVYDQAKGELTYSSAGHPAPAVRRDRTAIAWPQEASTAIGASKELRLAKGTFTLRPDDAVLLYTNGVIEATAPGGEPFGEGRLLERLNRVQEQTSRQLVESVMKALQNHRKDCPQPDDIALMAIRRME